MGDPVGLWVRRMRLLPGEVLRWRAACNWKQGGRVSGGHLGATSMALLFEPNRLDVLTGAESVRLPLGDIAAVSIEPGGSPSLTGGLRPRLRIERRNGTVELVLVNRVDQRLANVQEALAQFRAAQ